MLRAGLEMEGLNPLERGADWGRGAVLGVPIPRFTARARAVAKFAWLFL